MPKITITIEDQPDGGVFITGNPSPVELMQRAEQRKGGSPAEFYALNAWVAMRNAGQHMAKLSGAQVEEWSDAEKH